MEGKTEDASVTTFTGFQAKVKVFIEEEINSKLAGKTFDPAAVAGWTAEISEGILRRLASLKEPFKFVANCTILQRIGAGLHTSSSCLWNSKTDGSCTVRWESMHLYAIVIVYGLAL